MENVDESPVALDPSGDIFLIVNQAARRKTFRVSSFAMCLASPVWRAMLSHSGNFKEAHPKNGEVSFPEDDPDALCSLPYTINSNIFQKLSPAEICSTLALSATSTMSPNMYST